jgi:hypothetical protein
VEGETVMANNLKQYFIKDLQYTYHPPTPMVDEGFAVILTIVPVGECPCCKKETFTVSGSRDRITKSGLTEALILLANQVERSGK